MPRKSAADLATVPAFPTAREPPPPSMPEDEAAIWRQVVEGLPAHWLPAGSLPLLEVYCTAVVAMRHMKALMLAETEGSPRYAEASKAYHREAAMVVKLGKLLRIGPRHDRTKLRAIPGSGLPKPWDLAGGGAAPLASKFKGWGDPITAKEKPGGDEPPPDVG